MAKFFFSPLILRAIIIFSVEERKKMWMGVGRFGCKEQTPGGNYGLSLLRAAEENEKFLLLPQLEEEELNELCVGEREWIKLLQTLNSDSKWADETGSALFQVTMCDV